MDWIRENWFFLFVLIGFIMHMGHGHGGHGHGGHGGKGHGGHRPDDAAGSEAGNESGAHDHDQDDTGGRHAQH